MEPPPPSTKTVSVAKAEAGAGASAGAAPPCNTRVDSKMSICELASDTQCCPSSSSPAASPPKSKAYMDSLVPPSRERFDQIARIQQEKEDAHRRRDKELQRQVLHEIRHQVEHDNPGNRARAARLIQRTYRGYRSRREMQGLGLDASTRWMSALREVQFRESTRPKSRAGLTDASQPESNRDDRLSPNSAKMRWKKASLVARRAGHDDLDSDSSSSSSSDSEKSPEERQRLRERRDRLLDGRRHEAQMMGLQYFLEMVDVKHRYGSNLRMYHSEWKKSDTKENFFYWLDYGEGKKIELDACPRERLDRERIRYLSREERQYYLVKVDNEGKLRWAKNGALIDTTEKYRDSVHGIVPIDDPTPPFDYATQPSPSPQSMRTTSMASSGTASSLESKREADKADKYAGTDEEDRTGLKRVTHISPSTIWNKMLRRSVRDGTWIFVADTSFRLYVGIKNSGAFQHSSFLQGSRISAAGLIKIKNGKISSLSPLSGHYRPPASNFNAFVKSLREGGVDMSRVSISKAYVVLVGLEAYVKTRRKTKRFLSRMTHQKYKIVAPEEVKRRQEEETDKSQSAQREREVIAKEEAMREENVAGLKVMEKLKIAPREAKVPGEDAAGPSTEADNKVVPHGNV